MTPAEKKFIRQFTDLSMEHFSDLSTSDFRKLLRGIRKFIGQRKGWKAAREKAQGGE